MAHVLPAKRPPNIGYAQLRATSKILLHPALRRQQETGATEQGSAKSARLRLLLIDDDEVDRESVRRVLTESGLEFDLTQVSNAEEGLRQSRSDEYHCILLDYRFPTGDALELLGDLIATSCQARAPIVMLTGLGDEQVAARAFKNGVQDYLAKNHLSPTALRRAIEGAVREAELQRQLIRQTMELQRMSLYDDLTALPNRVLFHEKLEAKLKEHARTGSPFAVLIMDLDGFKAINDRLGHQCGDEVLRIVADRLASAVRQSDTIARLGGDEFAGLLEFDGGNERAKLVAEKLVSMIREPMPVGGQQLTVGISIGIAIFPFEGTDGEALVFAADSAMYKAKRDRSGFHASEIPARPEHKNIHSIYGGLQREFDPERFLVHYQPLINLKTSEIVGLESLVRWEHPDLGLLRPGEFISVAERTKAIKPLTLLVIRRSLLQYLEWRRDGLELPVSVNLSPHILDEDGLADDILSCITVHQLPAEILTLELTKTGLATSTDCALRTMRKLADSGIRLAIDDFGVGSSSLKRLKELPICEIKIDQAFVERLGQSSRDDAIVRAIVDLGRAMGARTIAEGIENDLAWCSLRDLGCEFGQGFRIGRPMSADRLSLWREQWIDDVSKLNLLSSLSRGDQA